MSQTTLIKNVRLFDGDKVYQKASVAFEGDKITHVLLSASDTLPEATTVIDGAGKTLLPGLIDAHVHAQTPGQ